NGDGQLGEPLGDLHAPRATAGGAAALALGKWLTCRVREDDRSLECRGSARQGRLGDGINENRRQAELVLLTLTDGSAPRWSAVALGEAHGCAITEAGELYCWGANDRAQLGSGTASA